MQPVASRLRPANPAAGKKKLPNVASRYNLWKHGTPLKEAPILTPEIESLFGFSAHKVDDVVSRLSRPTH
eukprot:scaffold472486_cov20-Prasinocladus_malaysianus.AAC.1